MCEAKPGTRCATDTRGGAVATLERYEAAHPGGPSVDPLTAATGIYQPRSAASTVGALQWVSERHEDLPEDVVALYDELDAYEAAGQYDEDRQFALASRLRRLGAPHRRKATTIDGVKVVAYARHAEDEGIMTAEHRLEFPDDFTRGSVYYGEGTGKWYSYGPGGQQTGVTREDVIAAQVTYWKASQQWPHNHDAYERGEDIEPDVTELHLPNPHTHPGRWWVRPPAELSKHPKRRFVTTPEAVTWAVDPGGKVWRRDEAGQVIDGKNALSSDQHAQIQTAAASDPTLR